MAGIVRERSDGREVGSDHRNGDSYGGPAGDELFVGEPSTALDHRVVGRAAVDQNPSGLGEREGEEREERENEEDEEGGHCWWGRGIGM